MRLGQLRIKMSQKMRYGSGRPNCHQFVLSKQYSKSWSSWHFTEFIHNKITTLYNILIMRNILSFTNRYTLPFSLLSHSQYYFVMGSGFYRPSQQSLRHQLPKQRFSTLGYNCENLVSCHKLETYIKNEKTISKLLSKGIKQLFPIQANSYNMIYKGNDIIASDRTGSGKTMAFTLPIIERLRSQGVFSNKKQKGVRFLIMAPTRELAQQITDEISKLNHYSDEIKTATLIGGADMRNQRISLRNNPKVIIATPGRLMDFYQRGDVSFQRIQVLCIDEADMMLQKGFKDDIEQILKIVAEEAKRKPQNLFFSATMPKWVVELTKKYMSQDKQYLNMVNQEETQASKTVEHICIQVSPSQKVSAIQYLIKQHSNNGSVLIFTAKKVEADFLAEDINVKTHVLHGDISQNQRTRRLKDFRLGKTKVLIATDVAARGLDIPSVQLIIQHSLPQNTDSYIHRSGRTGRAGRSGKCISLINKRIDSDLQLIGRIQTNYKVTFDSKKMLINQQGFEIEDCPLQIRQPSKSSSKSTPKSDSRELNPLGVRIILDEIHDQVDIKMLKFSIQKYIGEKARVRVNQIRNKNNKIMIFINFSSEEDCQKLSKLGNISVIGFNGQNKIEEIAKIKELYNK